MKNLPDAHPMYALRSRAGCRGDRGLSATATAYQPSSRVRNSSLLPPNQQHIHLVEAKYYEDTRPRSQLEPAHHQHSISPPAPLLSCGQCQPPAPDSRAGGGAPEIGKSIIYPRNLWVRGSNLTGGHNRLSCPRSADTALKPYLTSIVSFKK